MTAPPINLNELRAEAEGALSCFESAMVNALDLLALLDAVEAARLEHRNSIGRRTDHARGSCELCDALARFQP
jgi:hypothetical protein